MVVFVYCRQGVDDWRDKQTEQQHPERNAEIIYGHCNLREETGSCCSCRGVYGFIIHSGKGQFRERVGSEMNS